MSIDHIRIVVLNLKKRTSGVSSTIFSLHPILEKLRSDICYFGTASECNIIQISLFDMLKLCFKNKDMNLILHARRDHEIMFALILRMLSPRPIKIIFTWAAQRPKGWFTNNLCKRVDHIIATSVGASNFTPFKAHIINHGVAIQDEPPIKDVFPIKIAILGRVRPQKGTDIFVNALLNSLQYDFHAYIIGQTLNKYKNFADELKDLIKSKNASSRFTWINYIEHHHEVLDFLKTINIITACPRHEGYGLTLFEGAASGCAIIGTQTGAFPELIGDNERGCLIPCNDTFSLTQAFHELLGNPDRIRNYGQLAYHHVKKYYTIEQEAYNISCLYDKLAL